VLFEDGKQLRDYVAIEDVVSANLLALDHPKASGHVYNVGGGRGWTVLEVARILSSLAGTNIEPEIPGVYRVGDVRHVVSDISQLGALGWKPEAKLEAVWQQYLGWLSKLNVSAQIVDEAHARMSHEGVLRSI
jgi:dTDP-L-rhamnose 4-epimerase